MNTFDLLSLLAIATLGLATLRLRPAIMTLAGNELLVLRALSNIKSYGRPQSQSFLPPMLFSPQHLQTAALLMGLFGAGLFVAALWRGPTRPLLPPDEIPRLPSWIFVIVVLYIAVAFFSSKTLIESRYDNSAWTVGGVNLGGAKAFLLSLFLYGIYRAAASGTLSSFRAFLIVFVVLFLTDYAKGSTGLASGYILTAAVTLLGHVGGRARRTTLVVGALAAMAISAAVIRTLRADFYQDPSNSLVEASSSLTNNDARVKRTSEGLESSGNGTQYACHLLECIALYDTGIDRGWRSVYNPLIFTLEPSFLLEPLGLERPLDAPWELGHYYIHGGGIFIIGDMYWNGGILCLVVVGGLIIIFSYLCDTRYRHNIFWLMMAMQFTPGLLQGAGYGLAQVARGGFNGAIMIVVYLVFSKVLKDRPVLAKAKGATDDLTNGSFRTTAGATPSTSGPSDG